MLDCLNKGRINRHLSWLYRENLPALALDKTQGETITSLIGSTEVVLNRKECRKLIVVHRRLKGEETYWLQDGKVCVSVYDPEDLLFTEDEEQNRRLVTVDRKELLSFQDAVSAWGMEALRNGAQRALRFYWKRKKESFLNSIRSPSGRSFVQTDSWRMFTGRSFAAGWRCGCPNRRKIRS